MIALQPIPRDTLEENYKWREWFNSLRNALRGVTKSISTTTTLDFPSIASNSTEELTVSLTGAIAGQVVSVGAPAAIEMGLVFCGYVSAADTVTVRVHNMTGGAIDPASAVWTVLVHQ